MTFSTMHPDHLLVLVQDHQRGLRVSAARRQRRRLARRRLRSGERLQH